MASKLLISFIAAIVALPVAGFYGLVNQDSAAYAITKFMFSL